MLPKLAFTSFASRYRAPKLEEGFKEIIKVDFEVSVVQPRTRGVLRWYWCIDLNANRGQVQWLRRAEGAMEQILDLSGEGYIHDINYQGDPEVR
jgi:hypothetical protein